MVSETPLLLSAPLIVIAMRVHAHALICEQTLRQAGFSVLVCPEEVTASQVIATAERHRPTLLIIDDDIEWMEGVPVALRLYADPAFTALHFLILLRRSDRLPSWMGYGYSRFYSYMSKPFYPEYLLECVQHKFEAIEKGNFPAVSTSATPLPQTEDAWQAWGRELPPFALFEAAWKGNQAQVEKLLHQGVDVNAQNWLRKTALHLATERNRQDLIPLLLDAGAEIDARDGYGRTPLYIASLSADFRTMRLFLEHGADPNIPSHYQHILAIMLFGGREASKEKREEGFALLLAFGADPNAVGSFNETVLQWARRYKLPEIERLLLDYGAQP